MAYLGSIGIAKVIDCPYILDVWAATHAAAVVTDKPILRVCKKALAYWLPNPIGIDSSGYISGTVTEAGTPIANSMVQVFNKQTGLCLGRTYSASDGTFRFDDLPSSDSAQYFVVAHDVPGGTNYKAVIVDQLTPHA